MTPAIIVILQLIFEVVKLIMDLRKKNPVAAEQCSVAVREARKYGDTNKLRQILDAIENKKACE